MILTLETDEATTITNTVRFWLKNGPTAKTLWIGLALNGTIEAFFYKNSMKAADMLALPLCRMFKDKTGFWWVDNRTHLCNAALELILSDACNTAAPTCGRCGSTANVKHGFCSPCAEDEHKVNARQRDMIENPTPEWLTEFETK